MNSQPSLDDVAAWMLVRQPHFEAWPAGRLQEWLAHWAGHGALGVVRDGARILAVGIAYPCRRDQVGQPWALPDARGGCVYCEAVIAETPRAALGLILLLEAQVPDWRQRTLCARRRNRMQTFGLTFLRRWARRLAASFPRVGAFGEPSPILTYAS